MIFESLTKFNFWTKIRLLTHCEWYAHFSMHNCAPPQFNVLSQLFRFEYCYWRHNDRLCEFEWKRNAWAIRQQSCHGFNSRVKYIGDYDSHECKIELSGVGLDDAGNWTCDMESYVTGDHVSGYQVKRHLELIVLPKSDPSDQGML